jgi:integrase
VGSVIKVGEKWRAQVRRKGFRPQCRTFSVKARADAWVRQVETDMDAGAVAPQLGGLTVSEVIRAYRRLREEARPISDSSNEHYMLKALERGLGEKKVARLGPPDLVAYATMRRDEGAGPYTINMDVSKLGTVLRYGGAVLKVAMPDVVGSARPLLTHLRLIGGGGLRERRPQEDELRRIIQTIGERRGRVYAEAVAFSAITAMRRGEVCAVLKTEIDEANRVVPVWRKHPRKGKVLERVPLLGEAWDIAQRQPDSDDGRLFPIEAGTLSKYFTETCRTLGIPDLHLHDLRHEGTSRLFEEGYEIQQVALVTGHKDWRHLKRYTNLRPEDLHATRPAVRSRPDAAPPPGSPPSASRRPRKSAPGKTPR